MPSVTFDKIAFLKAIGRKLPDPLLAEKMSMLGTSVDEITPEHVTVEVFPNRPDLLSMQGFARAMRAFIGSAPGMRKYTITRGKTMVTVDPDLKAIRPYTACAIARKLKLDDSRIRQLIDIQEKLHGTYGRKRKRIAMGIYPLEHISLPIRFEARDPGDIVFTALDMEKPLPALQILKDHPKGKEYGNLLFGMRRFPVFVDSDERIMSLVPIVNSATTGKITETTREVFIEVSGFDFDVCHKALLMVCATIADMGGAVESVELRYGAKKLRTPDFTPTTMKLTAAAVNKHLGTELSQKQVCDALKKMGYDATGTTIKIPAYRADILHEVDLIEDVAIGFGYENLMPTIPQISTVGNESHAAALERTLRQLFVGLGYLEVKNFCLSSPETQVRKVAQMRRPIEMENPLTADYSVLRQQLLPGLLETLSRNKHNEYPQLIFEIGRVWTPDEELRLAFAIAGDKAGFTEAKATLEAVFRMLGKPLALKPYEEKIFISGRAAVLPGGFFGEVHPQIIDNFEIGCAVAAGEVRIKEVFE